MTARFLATSMALVAALAGAFRLDAAPFQRSTATPESMSHGAWTKLILENPDDEVLWNRELGRLKQFRVRLDGLGNQVSDTGLVLALASNDELQGIALRHLKRFPEALGALDLSEQRLATLWAQESCDSEGTGARCPDIAESRVRVQMFTTEIYRDMRDTVRADGALKKAVAVSRTTKRYADVLRQAVVMLLRREAFGPSSVLVVAEMQHAVDTSHEDHLTVAAGVAEQMLPLYFNGISWTAKQALRENDPRDFVDNTGIGIGRPIKYGMTDQSEDEATFFTAMFFEELVSEMKGDITKHVLDLWVDRGGYASVDELLQNAQLTDYVRREMLDGNFEPMAKYVYFGISDTMQSSSGQILVCNSGSPTIGFPEIRRRLRGTPAGTVAPTTSEILLAFDRLAQFRDANCRPRER